MRVKNCFVLKTFLFLLFVATCFFVVYKPVFADDIKKITVGFTQEETELNGHGSSAINKYASEYFDEMSKYTGHEYSYKIGTCEENIRKLENGEIDILCCCNEQVISNPKLALSDYYYEWHRMSVIVPDNNKPLSYKDFENFDIVSVGILDDGLYQPYIDAACSKLGLTIKYKKYKTKSEILSDLNSGKIDCGIVSFIKDDTETKTLSSINTHKNCFVINAENRELLDEINNAMEQIQAANAGFTSELLNKYYPQSINAFEGFTKEEIEFIKTKPKLKISYNFSNKNNSKSVMMGGTEVIEGILKLISETSGVEFDLVNSRNNPNIGQDIKIGNYSAMSTFCSRFDAHARFKDIFDVTDSYINVPVVIVGTEKLNNH
ncbi:MAG: transporter substrate-binding domain-containing protein, partial [Oscillospiraceae bacterium]